MSDVDRTESLLDWVGRLVCDAAARARLAEDPVAVLTEHGLVDLDPTDLRHALVLVAETVGARLDVLATAVDAVAGPRAAPGRPSPARPAPAPPAPVPITAAPSRRTT